MSRGIWINEDSFHTFAEQQPRGLAEHIATRARSGDFSAFLGLMPNPDPVLRRMGKSLDVYRELGSDAHVKGCLRRRRGAVKAMERGFERGEAKTRIAKNLQAIFDDLPMADIIEAACGGADFGYQPFEILWGNAGRFKVPVEVVAKPPEWFGYDQDNELRFRSRGQQLRGEALPPMRFVVSRNNASYINPYGEADLASVFWPTTFKRGGLKFWLTFTEKYGMPWAVGKQPRQAGMPEAQALLGKLEDMVQDAVAVIPDDSSVELLTVSSGANADLYEKLLHFCRSETSIALLGNNQSIEATANLASSKAAQSVEADLRDAMAEMVSRMFNELAGWVVWANWGESTVAPRYDLWEQEEVDDRLAKRDQLLVQAGARLQRQYFMDAYGIKEEHLGPDLPDEPAAGAAPGAMRNPGQRARRQAGGDGAAEFAEGEALSPDQAALDAAIEQLPAEAIDQAVRTLLQPALEAIAEFSDAEQARQALADAYPRMDAAALESLLARAFFVADLLGSASAGEA